MENGTFRLVSSVSPQHYDNHGILDDIDMNVENNGVHKCNYDIDLYPDRIGYHGHAPDGKIIELELLEDYVKPVIKDNIVTYPNVSTSVDYRLRSFQQ